MISVVDKRSFLAGLSTDDYAELEVQNGAIFYAMDEAKYYMYNADGEEWLEMPSGIIG